jgi:hypothetical protein
MEIVVTVVVAVDLALSFDPCMQALGLHQDGLDSREHDMQQLLSRSHDSRRSMRHD